jgi:hypothetical protein
MMQDSKFIPIDKKYTDPDYVNDICPFEIRFAFNSFAPYSFVKDGKKYPYIQRFESNSETCSGETMYPNDAEYGRIKRLYYQKELYTFIDDEIVCIDNDRLFYTFIERFKEGFERGYFEIKNNLEIENNAQTVFNIAVNESLSGLDTAYETHNYIKFLSDDLIFKSGVKTGRNYRAWQIILNKPYLYVDFFRKSEPLIGYYRWSLEYEIEKQTPFDAWGKKKGLEILLRYDIDPQLLEKVEKKMLDYGSLKLSVAVGDGEIKDILKANDKHRNIINRYDDLLRIHKDQKFVVTKMGRSRDLNVGTEKSSDKNRTDMITKILRGYGRIK